MQNLLDIILERFNSLYANSKNLKEAIDELNNTYEKISSTMNEKTKQLYDSIINTISSLTKINSQLGALKKTIDDIEIPSSSQTDILKSSKSKARLLLDPSSNLSNKILSDATKAQQAKASEQTAKEAQEARKNEVTQIKEKIDNYKGLITEIKGASEKFLGANNAISKFAGKALSVVSVLSGFEKTYNTTVETFEKLQKLKLSDFNIFTMFKKKQDQIEAVYNDQGLEIDGPPVSLKTQATKIKALDIFSSLYAAADLGFSSYSAGRQSGAMGILGSTVSGLASGAAIGKMLSFVGGPAGAAIGGAVGLGSSLFGWIFGGGARKLQRELTTIGQINEMVTKNLSALSGRTGQLVSTAGSGKFLEELNGQIGQINEQLGYISGQEVYAL